MARREDEQLASPRRRLRAVAFLLVVAFAALAARLYDLQIVQGAYYRELAEQNRLMRLPVAAERGVIYDRYGTLLARNAPGFAVKVLPADLPRSRQEEVARRLAELLGMPADEVAMKIDAGRRRTPYEEVAITATPVAREVALLVEERKAELPGVRVQSERVRHYVEGALYAPILGYTGAIIEDELVELRAAGYLPDDRVGRAGIERVYERYLRGTYGVREVERDAAQREIRVLAEKPPLPGANLVLTIDGRLQHLIAAELGKGIAENKMQAGVGIAINPQNGEVLALVSIPAYDDNAFIRGITAQEMRELNADPGRPLVNKGIADMYPPGSTFKIATGLAALNEGVANRRTVVNVSSAVLTVGGWNYYDWQAHGPLDFVGGFAHSSDIYFYTLGGGNPYTGQRGVGPEKIAEYARMLGFGRPTGIDIPGEVGGIIPDPGWKLAEFGEPWTIGNTYHMAIGQGFVAVTPLQLLVAYSAIANGGTVYRPHVLKEVVAADGRVVQRVAPEALRTLDVDPAHLRLLRESARRVVTVGHAWMPGLKIPIAGKTGTAEFGQGDRLDAVGRRVLAYHNWFVSWLPKQDTPDPTAEIAMVIFAYNTSAGCRADFCANPAISISQRVLEAYHTMGEPPQARRP